MQTGPGNNSLRPECSNEPSERLAVPEVSRIAEVKREAVIGGVVLPNQDLVHKAIWNISGIDHNTRSDDLEFAAGIQEVQQFVSELLEKLNGPGPHRVSLDYNNPEKPDELLPESFQKRIIAIRECKTGWLFETRRVSGSAAEGIKDIGSVADGHPIGQQAILTCTLYADAEGRGVANPVAATEQLNTGEGVEANFDDREGLLTVRLTDQELNYTFRVAVDRGWYSHDDVSAKIDGKGYSLGPAEPRLGYDTSPPCLRVTCLSDTGGYWVETHKGIKHLSQVMDLVQEAFLLTHNGASFLSDQDREAFRGDISRFPLAAMEAQAFEHILIELQSNFQLEDPDGNIKKHIGRLDDVLKGGVRDGQDIEARLKDVVSKVERTMSYSILSQVSEFFNREGLMYKSEHSSSSNEGKLLNGAKKFLTDLAAAASGNMHRSDGQYLPNLAARKTEMDRLFSKVTSRFQFDNEDQRCAFISLQGTVNRDPSHPLASAMEVWESRETVLKIIKRCCDSGGVYENEGKSVSPIQALAQPKAFLKQREALTEAGILDEEGRPTPATKAVAKFILVSDRGVQLDGAKAKV
jgi:hypothetical protein